MAALQPLIILFLLTIFQSTRGFLLKLTKDPQTHQYTTQLRIGDPQIPIKLVVHLSGPSLWVNCPPSRELITHGSLQCLTAKSGGQSQSQTYCDVHHQNPITGETSVGDLAEDVISVDGTVGKFLFSCSLESSLKGLVKGAKGVLGFGRSKIGFQSQMVNNFDLPRKFSVCLSSSDGFVMSGAGISNSLSYSYTPLMSESDGYYVHVNSVKVNGRRLGLGQPIGGVEVSTTLPYTVIKTMVYGIFTKAFATAATSMNMTLVSPVAPFGVCFTPQAVVPEIELVLQSELVKWRIRGGNSMVEVSDSVMCLGFVDGGMDMIGSMILGGYQLEDHMLEFDLGTGMMGFSSSLLIKGDSCSSVGASLSVNRGSL
ncbi:putative aspartic proteinase GIP2 [Bidens hawaiensis]|uniref:putative aspartic proteinase GIP2 n=1 Tax=Bidens hawaiensis TaxID=980011 RepID=UPI00404AAB0F